MSRFSGALQRFTALAAFAVAFGISAPCSFAQKGTGGGTGGGTPTPPPTPPPNRLPTPTIPDTNLPDVNSSRLILFLNGRVMMDGGGAPPQSVIVEQVCANRVRNRARTDPQGYFSFQLGQSAAAFDTLSNVDASEGQVDLKDRRSLRLNGCELRAVLAGHISSEIQLDGAGFDSGVREVGTIRLRPISATGSGATVSVTSYQVPDNARKEYEKAIKLVDSGDAKRAEERLRKAVEIYPKYANAWVSLGELQKREQKYDDARASFARALEADRGYVPPYVHLAYFAAKDQNWNETLKLSNEAIRLDPVDFADAFYLNAVAHYNLHHLPESRRSAQKAVELDGAHRIPRVLLLLATIYETTGERELAVAEFKEFLKLHPDSPDSATAREHIEKLNSQTANATN